MRRRTEQILSHAEGLPEGAPIAAKSLLHLGNRAAVDQALSRLAERGRLMRAGRGVYLRPISGRFGVPAPSVEKTVQALAAQRGEVIVSNGAAAANALGLTTQVPVRSVYLTSGRSRAMNLGQQVVELRHAPMWQLALADRPAGQAVRACARLAGARKSGRSLEGVEAQIAGFHVRRTRRGRTPITELACQVGRQSRSWLKPSSHCRRTIGARSSLLPPIDPAVRLICFRHIPSLAPASMSRSVPPWCPDT